MRKLLLLLCCVSVFAHAQEESLRIGPGDELRVQVFDTPDLDETARVTDSGEIPLVMGGSIRLASLTPTQAARNIEAALRSSNIMNYPKVMVAVTHYATQNVTVFGEVAHPGAYPIDTPRSVMEVITLAGGLTELADRHVTIERHFSKNQVAYYVSNRPSEMLDQKVVVNPGDKVVVPKAGIVYVLGDVGHPGGYPMTNNDATLTVLQAVAQAGGTTTSAAANRSRLVRKNGAGYDDQPLQIASMQKGKKPDRQLQPGDIIYVPFSWLRNAALGATNIAASVSGAAVYAR